MSRRLYECETCGEEHRFPISAALCCEVTLPGDDTIQRSSKLTGE